MFGVPTPPTVGLKSASVKITPPRSSSVWRTFRRSWANTVSGKAWTSHVPPQSVQMWTQPPRRRPTVTVVVVASTNAPSSPQPPEPIAREPPPRRAEEGLRGRAGRRRPAAQQRTKTAAAGEDPAGAVWPETSRGTLEDINSAAHRPLPPIRRPGRQASGLGCRLVGTAPNSCGVL